MDVTAFGVTFATCIFSIFGMNLDSGLFEDPHAFYLTVLLVFVSTCFLVALGNFKFGKITKSGGVGEEGL
jgi:hypothetical protein